MTSETFKGKYCYFIHDESEGDPYTCVGTCNADDHWQALEKFRQGLGTSGLEHGHTYSIIRDAGRLGKLFRMRFVF